MTNVCTFCVEEIETNDTYFLPCAHYFHIICFSTWRNSGKIICPVCRTPMFIDSEEQMERYKNFLVQKKQDPTVDKKDDNSLALLFHTPRNMLAITFRNFHISNRYNAFNPINVRDENAIRALIRSREAGSSLPLSYYDDSDISEIDISEVDISEIDISEVDESESEIEESTETSQSMDSTDSSPARILVEVAMYDDATTYDDDSTDSSET